MFIDGERDLKFTLFRIERNAKHFAQFGKRKMEVSAAYKHFAATRLF